MMRAHMGFDANLTACAQIVERGDPARFRTVMAAPLAAREKLFPLYAFNVEVSRAPWVTAEPMIAEMRLQWWRDVLAEIGAGGPVRRHEVATPLAAVLAPSDAHVLDEIISVRIWDCYKDSFDDAAHLERYLTCSSGHLMQVAATLLGGDAAPARAAGFGLGVANWLRAIPALEASGRIPLVDGTPDGVRALAQQGLANLQSARRGFAKPALPAFWPATGAARVLKAAIRDPGRVAAGTLPEPGRMRFAITAAMGRW